MRLVNVTHRFFRPYLVVVQRGVVAQGADGSQLDKAIVVAAINLAASLGAERQHKVNEKKGHSYT